MKHAPDTASLDHQVVIVGAGFGGIGAAIELKRNGIHDFVIGAVGGLEQPKLPDIDGVDTFEGKAVHTARWDHDYDYRGKRIAVIGTGATALQLIPDIAQIAGR